MITVHEVDLRPNNLIAHLKVSVFLGCWAEADIEDPYPYLDYEDYFASLLGVAVKKPIHCEGCDNAFLLPGSNFNYLKRYNWCTSADRVVHQAWWCRDCAWVATQRYHVTEVSYG